MDVLLRHPAHAKVTTSRPGAGAGARLRGLDLGRRPRADVRRGPQARARSARCATGPAVSTTRTSPACPASTSRSPRCRWRPCPTRSSIRRATARTCSPPAVARSPGRTCVAGREAILLECDHPRAIEVAADRPDFKISIAVDRQLGVILRLAETIGGEVTRHAEVTDIGPDAPLPPAAFDFVFPTGTTMLY